MSIELAQSDFCIMKKLVLFEGILYSFVLNILLLCAILEAYRYNTPISFGLFKIIE